MSAPEDKKAELEGSRAPLLDHLEELRWRTWRALLGVLAAAILCGIFHEELFFFLTNPLFRALEHHELETAVKFRTLTGAFLFHFKTAVFGGLFVSIPWVLYQIWRFVAPGLYKQERMLAFPFVFFSTICFVGGALFSYYLVLPEAFDYLIGLSLKNTTYKMIPDITIEDYLSFTTKLLLAFGISFEMPVATAFFSAIGLITHHMLIRFWRFAVVLAFVLAALLTPPDYITQIMLAIPLLMLYVISVGIAYFFTTRRERAGDEAA
ncbi:twin-arginine translocase subunit TatC [Myxococcota bacterium]|nr:twin-arginine translocase subunit TatC [Myxococcota bacterium]